MLRAEMVTILIRKLREYNSFPLETTFYFDPNKRTGKRKKKTYNLDTSHLILGIFSFL